MFRCGWLFNLKNDKIFFKNHNFFSFSKKITNYMVYIIFYFSKFKINKQLILSKKKQWKMERFLKLKFSCRDLQSALFKTNQGKLNNYNLKLAKI